MTTTVPCTGHCGVDNHVAGSKAAEICQVRTAAIAAHPAGKGRAGTASSDFSETAEQVGRREAFEYLTGLDESLVVVAHYRDEDALRADIAEVDAEIDRLESSGDSGRYDPKIGAHRPSPELNQARRLKDALVNSLAERTLLIERIGEEGYAAAQQAERDQRKIAAITNATRKPPSSEADWARHEVLSDEKDVLSDRLDDYRADNGDPWKQMRDEWRARVDQMDPEEGYKAYLTRQREVLVQISSEHLMSDRLVDQITS